MSFQFIQRYEATRVGPENVLWESIEGSALACGLIATRLQKDYLHTEAVCIHTGLLHVQRQFEAMKSAFVAFRETLRSTREQSVWGCNATTTVSCVQEACKRIAREVKEIVQGIEIWDVVVPDRTHYRLKSLELQLWDQQVNLELLTAIMHFVRRNSNVVTMYGRGFRPFKAEPEIDCAVLSMIRDAIDMKQSIQCEVMRLPPGELQRKKRTSPHTSEELPNTDSWSLARLCMATTTVPGAVVTRHALERCGHEVAYFLRLIGEVENRPCHANRSWSATRISDEDVQQLQKSHLELVITLFHGLNTPWPFQTTVVVAPSESPIVNTDSLESCGKTVTYFLDRIYNIQERLGHAPASMPVNVQCLHMLYVELANRLLRKLAAPTPFPGQPPPADPEVTRPIAQSTATDETYEAIVQSMKEYRATDTDVMKLVFHWTTLTLHNEFWRKDVMKLVDFPTVTAEE